MLLEAATVLKLFAPPTQRECRESRQEPTFGFDRRSENGLRKIAFIRRGDHNAGWIRRVDAAFSRWVCMLELAQYLAGMNLFALMFGALIFDIPRNTFSLISLALLATLRGGRHGDTRAATLRSASSSRASTPPPGSTVRSPHCAGRPCRRSRLSSSMTAPRMPPARSPNALTRAGRWTWLSATARVVAAAQRSTPRRDLPAATAADGGSGHDLRSGHPRADGRRFPRSACGGRELQYRGRQRTRTR